jgi:hypothetical protein
MIATIVSVALFALLMGVISWIGYRFYSRPARFYDQLGTPTFHDGFGEAGLSEGVVVRIVRRIGEKVPVSPQDVGMTRRMLLAAGYRSDSALGLYYGLKVVAGAALLVLGLSFQGYLPAGILRILLIAAAAAAGYFAPTLVLEAAASLISRTRTSARNCIWPHWRYRPASAAPKRCGTSRTAPASPRSASLPPS